MPAPEKLPDRADGDRGRVGNSRGARVIAEARAVRAELETLSQTVETDSKPRIAERLAALAARLGRIEPGGQALSVAESPAEYGGSEA